MMDDAGMLSMLQLIAHVKKSVAMDHVIASQMRAQNVSFYIFIDIFFFGKGNEIYVNSIHVKEGWSSG